jgi:glutathione S-transferase
LIHTRPDGSSINVFESASIIQYLFERFDTEHKFTFPQFSDDAAQLNNWIYWGHASISPTLGSGTFKAPCQGCLCEKKKKK